MSDPIGVGSNEARRAATGGKNNGVLIPMHSTNWPRSKGSLTMLSPGAARKTLAAIRIFNGTAGLLAPEMLLGRLGVDTTKDRSGTYPFRMFGIRTILIGLDLLLLTGDDLRRAEKLAVLIRSTHGRSE